jgi:hypothetical protein
MSDTEKLMVPKKKIQKLCPHNKRKSRCVQCGGKGICEHDRIRSRCKECRGSEICEHNQRHSQCKECRGSQICEHNRRRLICKECGGSQICEHDRIRSSCKECRGGSICEHDKIRYNCKECRGGSICEHNRYRSHCKECKGSQICEHDRNRSRCIICNPSVSCEDCKLIFVSKRTQYYPLCEACYCTKHPDCEKSRHYKLKEHILRDELRSHFKDHCIDLFFDKRVEGGCSRRKPDVLIDCLLFSIVIECDEFQHKQYDSTCEHKRMMELFEDLGSRPLIMIRFNPDSYTHSNGTRIKTCFNPLISEEDSNRKRFYDIQEEEWKARTTLLKCVISQFLQKDTFPEKEITELQLFYDGFDYFYV